MSGQSDAIFAKFVLKARMVTDEDLNACVGYQSRLRSEGKHISLGQALIKKRLLKASQFLQIRKRLETQTFLCGSCQAPFSWRDVEGRSDARCASCNNLLSAGGFDGSAKEVTSEGRPRVTLPAKKEQSKGARFGHYEILELIGQGGMGLVYKARQMDLNRIVAIKMLKEGEGASPEQVERFKREAQSAAKLQHPNIIGIHEVGVESGYHYFTMDYVEGDTLQDCFNRGEVFAEGELLRLSEPIARALHYAHTKGVVHRDVKPANIILDSEGNPKITDFGLAKIETDSNLTKSGVAIGTPLYMSPEQARGDLKAIDNRSDLFSLGIIMYQMSTGRLPFIGDSHIEIYNQIIYEESTPPRRYNPKLSRDAEIIILKALEKLPRNRYQSCGELAEDVARTRVGEAIRAKPLGLIEKFLRTTLRHRSFLGGVVIGLVMLVVFLILFASWSKGPGPDNSDLSKQRRELLAAISADHERGQWRAVISGAEGFQRNEYAYSEEAVQAFMLAAEAVRELEMLGESTPQSDAEVLLGRALRWAQADRRDDVYLQLGKLFLDRHDPERLGKILARVANRSRPEFTSLSVRHKILGGDAETALRQLGAVGGSQLDWLAGELRKWTPQQVLTDGAALRCSATADNVLYLCRDGSVFVLREGREQLLPLEFGPGIDEPDPGTIRAFSVFPSGERAFFALQRESGRLQLGTVEERGLRVEFQSPRRGRGLVVWGDLLGDPVPEVYLSGGPQGKVVSCFEKAGNLWRERALIDEESAIRALLVQDESLFLVTEGPLSWLRVFRLRGAGSNLTETASTRVGNVSLLARGQEGALFGRSETASLLYLVNSQRPNGVYSVKLQGVDIEAAPLLVLGRGVAIDDIQQHLGVSFCLYTVYASGQERSVLRIEGHDDSFEMLLSEVRGRQLHLLDLDGDADAELVITGPEGMMVMGRAP